MFFEDSTFEIDEKNNVTVRILIDLNFIFILEDFMVIVFQFLILLIIKLKSIAISTF